MLVKRFAFSLAVALAMTMAASASTVGVAVWSAPTTTVAGGTIVANTAVRNLTTTSQAVSVTLTVTGPCANLFPAKVGTVLLGLKPNETRDAAISFRFPAATCMGTYNLTVTVKNSSGTVLATKSTTLNIGPAPV
jgi:hypothetical protein